MADKKLTVQITGDAKNVRRVLNELGDDVDRVDRRASGAASGWQSSMGLIGGAAVAATAAAGAAAVGLGILTARGVSNAADLGESINAVQVSLGDGAQSFLEFGEDSANSLGITQAALNQAITPMAAILRNAGDGGEELSGKLQDLSVRATDVASVFNVETTEALDAFGASLRGEQEPIRRFGVSIDDAAVKAKAMELGLADASGEVDRAAKVQATYALIMEQTNIAAGDFANTADSLPNTMKRVKASAEEALTALGAPLLAPLADAANMLAGSLAPIEPILGTMGQTMGNLVGPTASLVEGIMSGLVPALEAGIGFVDELVNQIGPDLQEWAEDNGEALEDMGDSAAQLIDAATPLIPLIVDVAGFFLDMATAGLEGAAMLADVATTASDLSQAMGPFGGLLGGFTAGADSAAESGGGFADVVSAGADAAGGFGGPVTDAAAALYEQADAATAAEDSLKAWKDILDEAFGQVDVVGALAAYEQSIDDLTEAFMINGSGIDLTTEAGRNNSLALKGVIDDAKAAATALAGEGRYEEAQFLLAGTREQIINNGISAGQTRDEMELYLAALGLTPEEVETTVGLLGVPQAEGALEHVTRDREAWAWAKHTGTQAVENALDRAARTREAWIVVGLRYSGQAAAYAAGNVDVNYGRAAVDAGPGGRSTVGRSTVGLLDRSQVIHIDIDGKTAAKALVGPLGVVSSRSNGGRR